MSTGLVLVLKYITRINANMFLRDGKIELRTRSLWIEVFAEFLATLLFLFMVCGTVLPWNYNPPSVMHIAFSHGLSIATLAMSVLHISGGQLNPAVTISMMAARRISMLKALFFIIAQCTGGKDLCKKKIIFGLDRINRDLYKIRDREFLLMIRSIW